jgi:peptide deformylase
MASDSIVLYGNEVLRTRTQPVDPADPELPQLIQRMFDILREANGLGLAANQIGLSKNVFVYDVGEGPEAMLNAKIVKRRGRETGTEGCLSIPGLQGEVRRATTVLVEGMDRNGNPVQIKAEGLLARVFQHEIDHLNGSLFIDHADPDSLEWLSDEDQ